MDTVQAGNTAPDHKQLTRRWLIVDVWAIWLAGWLAAAAAAAASLSCAAMYDALHILICA
jgi:hypothetical protein